MPEINGARLLDSLQTLRTFGTSGTGVIRPTFSNDDMAARQWLRGQMEASGLEALIDGVGNVVGRSRNPGPALIIGSHSDTQPRGGWLDGAMGVMYAIEIARAFADDPATSGVAVDAIAWSDEEGTYSSCLGSASFVGDLTEEEMLHANGEGESVAKAIERVGLSGTPRMRLDRDRHIAYLEAHIEQGPYLEEAGLRVGVVTSIVGIRGMCISFEGEQNHAGTTPMERRKDAGVAMFDFGVRIRERLIALAGPTTVWTFGKARLEPGAESIIAGSAELTAQFRDPDDELLDRLEAEFVAVAHEMTTEGPVRVSATRRRQPIAPTPMDSALGSHISAAAQRRVPGGWVEMPSAAGHDPMVLARHLPCGMLFIPSIDGVRHDFAEDSAIDDIVVGCQVLTDEAASILDEHRR